MTELEERRVADHGWPEHLRPGALRWARTSGHYDDTVAFYRDLVGLPVVGSFAESFGEDGTIFGFPDTGTQMELVRGQRATDPPGRLDQVVLYLTDRDAVTRATAGLRDHGLTPEPDLHPYWDANGAVMYVDPDGRGVVYAPWIYGREPDPADRQSPDSSASNVRIELHSGPREPLRPLFELAEDSAIELDAYLGSGRVLVARSGDTVVGHLQLVDSDRPGEVELKNMAVLESLQGRGIGGRLVREATELVSGEATSALVVATASADIDNLRFYQRHGFRMRSVERDAFTAQHGYQPGTVIDGIELRDRVWLDLQVSR